MSRLKGRIEAAESKAGIGRQDNRIDLLFVEGWPEDVASEFLKKEGHDLSRPHRIVCFVPAKDGKPARAFRGRNGTVSERCTKRVTDSRTSLETRG